MMLYFKYGDILKCSNMPKAKWLKEGNVNTSFFHVNFKSKSMSHLVVSCWVMICYEECLRLARGDELLFLTLLGNSS